MSALKAKPDERPLGLALYNPVVDLRITAQPDEMRAAMAISPSDLPLDGAPVTIIMQGDDDHTTPIQMSRAFCARMKAASRVCQLIEYSGRDHGFFNDRTVDPRIGRSPYDDTLAKTEAFLKAYNNAKP